VPATTPDDDLLRREVGMLRRRESRRVFDTAVYSGSLGGERTSLVVRAQDLPMLDVALRTDLVGRLLTDCDGTTVWLTRAGVPEVYDSDLAWLGAAGAACMEHGLPLAGFYVVTRTGWLDPRTGRSRTWKRLRL